MDALQFYESSSDSDVDEETERRGFCVKRFKPAAEDKTESSSALPLSLPPPPPELFSSIPDAAGTKKRTRSDHGGRVRAFPHVEGNYALHVYIPVVLSASIRTKIALYLQKAVSLFPSLKSTEDDDLSANVGSNQGIKLATEFHISLGRTVPIRIHQIDTMVHLLRRKFEGQKRFLVEFGTWEVFVNDDRTRSFLSLEVVATGYAEIKKQVSLVDHVYTLHGLPTFYPNPRPHISLAWALGDVKDALATVAQELNTMACFREEKSACFFTSLATKVECRIGQKLHPIWTTKDKKSMLELSETVN
ncbi:uncharacterized protein [Physcomitrium patens]|uniref:U6 snRNA phosphodiesterase n=1 Tax=Physcomitrium patens TaxID=3218 RepID=A9T750_PHYPA|nr:U6 snRNA phosphodiesterase-like isoform X1 [Physcomitrium patens]PNR42001.1 hypothetical protein PHYPA_016830 [Physcomitrium patens]|eukprot:XP_024392519.1 U6 snRNA phosphodiesterase-like isoform X1 [Physcomitrella patens]